MFAEVEFVVICAFCSRMRSGEGHWISLPPRLSQLLQQETARISHTYCPECVARHYPGKLNPNGSARRG
jgi:hypothetical protein